jgi:hypothetical protein
MLPKQVAIEPTYGWGWIDNKDADWDAVPRAFMAEVDLSEEVWSGQAVKTLRGSVTESDHELNGFSVLLSPRHNPWDGHVNVELKSVDGRQVNGFASIDIASFE